MQKCKSLNAVHRGGSAQGKITLGQVVLEMGSCILSTISGNVLKVLSSRPKTSALDKTDLGPGICAVRHEVLLSPPSAKPAGSPISLSTQRGRGRCTCPSPVPCWNRTLLGVGGWGGVEVRLQRASCVILVTRPRARAGRPVGLT